MIIRIASLDQREGIRSWLKDRGIYNDLYEIGYDFGSSSVEEGVELVRVLRIEDGVLTDTDVTEFVLRFGQ